MDVKLAADSSSAHHWRTHCLQYPERFHAPRGAGGLRSELERWEEQLIAQLQDDGPAMERAIALRQIVDLRGCTTREAASFFGVAPHIVVSSISLLEIPGRRTNAPVHAAVSATIPLAAPARTRAA